MPLKIDTIFFDLDGTLLDTAPDLANAINQTLKNHQRPEVIFNKFRFHVHGGTQEMLAHGFNISIDDPQFEKIKQEFLQIYRDNLHNETKFFPQMETLLNHLEQQKISWGIVTSKPGWLAKPLLKAFDLHKRSICMIYGDSIKNPKPNPEPLLHACQLTHREPSRTAYIGDTEVDIIAAKAAGMHALAVMHGYRSQHSKPERWNADKLVGDPLDIIKWLNTQNG